MKYTNFILTIIAILLGLLCFVVSGRNNRYDYMKDTGVIDKKTGTLYVLNTEDNKKREIFALNFINGKGKIIKLKQVVRENKNETQN